jgi:hypothetical protein
MLVLKNYDLTDVMKAASEKYALLGYYVASSENNTEECSSQLLHGGSMKSRKAAFVNLYISCRQV